MSKKVDIDWVIKVISTEVPEVMLNGEILMPLSSAQEQESFLLDSIVKCSENVGSNPSIGVLFPNLLSIVEFTEDWDHCWKLILGVENSYSEYARKSKFNDGLISSRKEIATFLGFCAERLGRDEDSIGWFRVATEFARNLSEREQVEALLNFARVLEDLGNDEDSALESYFEALNVSEKSDGAVEDVLVARVQNSIGYIYKNKEDFDSASKHYQCAINILERLEDEDLELAAAVSNLARAQLEKGLDKIAVSNLKKAKKILKRSGNDEHPLYDSIVEQLEEI